MLTAFAIGTSTLIFAQRDGTAPPKPPTTQERLKKVAEKLNEGVGLRPDQKEKVLASFKEFFDGVEEEIKKQGHQEPPPPPPPPLKKEIMEKLQRDRDEKIKKILDEAQFEKYKKIEKDMRPRHPGGPHGPEGERDAPPRQ